MQLDFFFSLCTNASMRCLRTPLKKKKKKNCFACKYSHQQQSCSYLRSDKIESLVVATTALFIIYMVIHTRIIYGICYAVIFCSTHFRVKQLRCMQITRHIARNSFGCMRAMDAARATKPFFFFSTFHYIFPYNFHFLFFPPTKTIMFMRAVFLLFCCFSRPIPR